MRRLVSIFALVGAAAWAQWADLDRAIEAEAKRNSIPAMTVAISDADRTLHNRHAGSANAQTVYRAGPVTRLFIAITAMRLVEQGKLDLDAPLRRYLPKFSGNASTTPRQLMAHRSGLLGDVIERVSGERLEAALRLHVWDVVGMKNTYYALPPSRRAACRKLSCGRSMGASSPPRSPTFEMRQPGT